jgi:octaprenyl-diphosphate synthase
MTLPLIFALNNATRSDKRRIINIVKKHNEIPEKVNEVIEFVRGSGGLEYAEKAMLKYRTDAFSILHSFPSSPTRESLEDLVNFSTDRKK